jgi:hypothetical protein
LERFKGEIYLVILHTGLLHYNKKKNVFEDDKTFPFPKGWAPNTTGVFENVAARQYWFACFKGLCIYDEQSKQMWYRDFNPRDLPVLKTNVCRMVLARYILISKKAVAFQLAELGRWRAIQVLP